jgi:hypothetical protein
MKMSPPLPDEYLPYYGSYINRVTGAPFAFMAATHAALHAAVDGLSDVHASARPAPDEWNIKEVIGHVCDGERLFAYRALRFARNDATPLASMEPNPWVANGNFGTRSLANLMAEFDAVRAATLPLFQSFSDEVLLRRGEASGAVVSVRALLYIIAGHEDHHLASIREVYL